MINDFKLKPEYLSCNLNNAVERLLAKTWQNLPEKDALEVQQFLQKIIANRYLQGKNTKIKNSSWKDK